MDQQLNRRSLLIGSSGLVLQVTGALGNAASQGQPVMGIVFTILLGVGTLLLMWGLALYATAKGHSSLWCLLGFLSIVGLIGLALLPDRAVDRSLAQATTAPSRTSSLAFWALFLSIASLVTCGLTFILSIAAVICGHVGLVQVKRSAGTIKGRRVLLVGVIMGYIGIGLGLIFLIVLLTQKHS